MSLGAVTEALRTWQAAALASVVVGAAAVLAAPGAVAGEGDTAPRQTASLKFTTERPGKSTGTMTTVDYFNPEEPGAKPPAVREFILRLPKGAHFDTSVPDSCPAPDEELIAEGDAACPPGSEVGRAEVTVDSGFPGGARYAHAHVTFFNAPGQLISVNTIHGTNARTVIRGQVTNREVIIPTDLPGAPPDGASVDLLRTFDPPVSANVDGVRRHYVTTPHRCPASGRWISKLIFTYADGVTQRVRSPIRCVHRAGLRARRQRSRPQTAG